MITSVEIEEDLLAAEDCGEKSVMDFMQNHVIGSSGDIFSPIKSKKLKTFSSRSKSKNVASQESVLQNDKKLFTRLLIIGQSRKVDVLKCSPTH